MVSIGMGLMGDAKLLMLDEPTLGLAPKLKDEVCTGISKLVSTGVPLILVEQDMQFMLELTDRLYLIEQGKVVLESTADSVDNSQVLERYFGRSQKAVVGPKSMNGKTGMPRLTIKE